MFNFLRSIRNIPQKSRMLLAGLVTNYREGGGAQNGRGDVKLYPYEKGGGEFWGSFSICLYSKHFCKSNCAHVIPLYVRLIRNQHVAHTTHVLCNT